MSDRIVVDRREFLAASSACAVAATLVGPRLFASEQSASGPRMAIGFARDAEEAALAPASGIPSSDGGFIGQGALVAVSGTAGASADPRAHRAVELLTHFSYLEGATIESAPFRAWASSRVTGGQGNPIRFTVPVDLVQKIDMSVVVESGNREPGTQTSRRRAIGGGTSSTSTSTLPVSFALQEDPAAVKLVRGFYVLVPLVAGDAEPSWSDFHLFRRDGRWTLVDGAGAVAPFEHLVVHIGYAMGA